MKFRFFNRRSPNINAPNSDSSTIDESEVRPLSSSDQCTSNHETTNVDDERNTVMSVLERGQITDESRMGKAVTIISTICSMIESECNGSAYDPSRNHFYFSDVSDSRSTAVDEKCRSKMLEWCFKMVDFFNIDRCIVSLATSYQDRFLLTSMGSAARTCRETFRIASVTCLYIAIKLYVPHKWNVTAHAFAQLCRGTISGESIVEMEMRVLFALEWNVHPPIPMSYVELIFDLIAINTASSCIERRRNSEDDFDEDSVIGDLILPCLSGSSSDNSAAQECTRTSVRENIIELARYQIELTPRNVNFLRVRSSLISLAALLNAIEGIISGNEASAPNVISFCRESVAVIAKILSCSNLCSKRELDEVRAALLCSVMAMPDGKIEITQHYNSHSEGQSGVKSPPSSIISSPTSTSNWNYNREVNDYLSPKSLLSRVCAMHCQFNIR